MTSKITFKVHGLDMGGKVISWEGVWMCDEYMKNTVNKCVNECERGCRLEDGKGTSKLESVGREKFAIRMI